MKTTALIVGGTSGLGLAMAELLSETHMVVVTGRKEPKTTSERIRFHALDLAVSESELVQSIDALVASISESIDLFVYAAGYYQEGTISELSESDIRNMNNVGLLAPALLLERILKKQGTLPGFVAITSTSQWTPRLLEPMYTAVKAGLGMLAQSVSLDPKVTKVLVAGPAGMQTAFWDNTDLDQSTMLDPKWAAEQVMTLWNDAFTYKFARVLREPPRVEVVETRA